MSLFKKRKVSQGGRKKQTEEDANDIDEEETQISKLESKSKLEQVTTKTNKNENVSHTFESSGSAVASGKVDQGATVDTSNDVANRISGVKAG